MDFIVVFKYVFFIFVGGLCIFLILLTLGLVTLFVSFFDICFVYVEYLKFIVYIFIGFSLFIFFCYENSRFLIRVVFLFWFLDGSRFIVVNM